MHLEYAAHVTHPVSHTADAATIGLGLLGAAIVAVVVIYSGGTALTVLSAASAAGGLGMDAGKVIDRFSAPSTAGHVTSGVSNVFLGPSVKPAARANMADTKVDCHDEQVAEGSKIVMIGQETKPMSRRGDRTKCGGLIADGVRSIFVGGDPSQLGQPIDEEDSRAASLLGSVFDLTGGATSIAKGNVSDFVGGTTTFLAWAAKQSGNEDLGNVINVATIRTPNNVLDVVDSSVKVGKGASSAITMTSQVVAPTPAPTPTPRR
jgi:uncharacterized Zn-binding protein involved in type VI secretion